MGIFGTHSDRELKRIKSQVDKVFMYEEEFSNPLQIQNLKARHRNSRTDSKQERHSICFCLKLLQL